jgi:uncharacterized protein YbbK (DUF523 family)
MNKKDFKICSACLLGINCRYNGEEKVNEKTLALLKKENLIPVCPEQLGGLSTPREPAEKKRNKVITKSGKDVTANFKRGAKEVLKIVKFFDVKQAVLKQRSPSCGCGMIYDGTFSNRLIKGDGITTILLKKNKIKVISEEDL